jgi:hypothetical protein
MWEKGFRMVFNPDAKVYHSHSDGLWAYMRKKYKIGFWKALVLRDHPGKIVEDSHTPQSLKLEMAFAVGSLACLAFSLVNGGLFWWELLPLLGFLMTAFPFVWKVVKKDLTVAFFSPLILFARAVSLSLGLVVGGIHFNLISGKP